MYSLEVFQQSRLEKSSWETPEETPEEAVRKRAATGDQRRETERDQIRELPSYTPCEASCPRG